MVPTDLDALARRAQPVDDAFARVDAVVDEARPLAVGAGREVDDLLLGDLHRREPDARGGDPLDP